MNIRRSSSSRWTWLIVAAVLATVIWFHSTILAPFIISLVLAYVLRPAVESLVKRKWPRALAVSACLLGVVFAALVVFILLVPIVYEVAPMLQKQLPNMLAGWWSDIGPKLARLGVPVPESTEEIRAGFMGWIEKHGTDVGASVWQSVVAGGGSVMAYVGLALLIPMLAFYWLIDWDQLMPPLKELVPTRWRRDVDDFALEADDMLGQYLRGQLTLMGILAIYYSIGLALFGFSLALPIGVFTGLAVCIPYIGYGLGLILALFAGVFQFTAAGEGIWQPLIGVAVVYGLGQVIESFYLTPRLVGERIGLHPLGVIFALMLFGQWMGFIGLLIALPCAALVTVLGQRLLKAYRQGVFFQTE